MTSERSWAGKRFRERRRGCAWTDTLFSGSVAVVKLGLSQGCREACKTGPRFIHPHG